MPFELIDPTEKTGVVIFVFFFSKSLDLDYKRLPCRDAGNTVLQYHCRHHILCCLFDGRERPKCLETWAQYGVDGYCIHGKHKLKKYIQLKK